MTKPKKSITVNGKDVVVSEIDDGALMKNWLDKVFCGGCVGFVGGVFVGFVGVIVVSLFYGLRNSTGNGMKNGSGGRRGGAWLIKGYDTYDDEMLGSVSGLRLTYEKLTQ